HRRHRNHAHLVQMLDGFFDLGLACAQRHGEGVPVLLVGGEGGPLGDQRRLDDVDRVHHATSFTAEPRLLRALSVPLLASSQRSRSPFSMTRNRWLSISKQLSSPAGQSVTRSTFRALNRTFTLSLRTA